MFPGQASSSSCFNTYQNPDSLKNKRARREFELEEKQNIRLPTANFHNHNGDDRSFKLQTYLDTPPYSSDDDEYSHAPSSKRAALKPLDSHLKQNTIRLLLQGSREFEKRSINDGDTEMHDDNDDDDELSLGITGSNPLSDPRQKKITKYFPVVASRSTIVGGAARQHCINDSSIRCYRCCNQFPILDSTNELEIILQLNLNFKCTKCGNLACEECSMKSNITGNNRECIDCLKERYDF